MSKERYLRHSLIDWFSQETIARTRVVVIGAGAVGNEVLKNLILLGVGEIRVYDPDLIEEHNLTRSVLFRESDVGSPKAMVAAKRARELDRNANVEPVVDDFWNHLTIRDLRNFDLLICCVDNFEARLRCNILCRVARTDLVNVGIDSRFALVEQFPFSRDKDGACFECNLPHSVYQRISERYSCGHLRKRSFAEKKVPTTIITSTAAASLAVSVGLRLGSEDADPVARRFYLDTIAGGLTRTELDRANDCSCCDRFARDLRVIACRALVGAWPEGFPDCSVIVSDPILAAYRIGNTTTTVFERAADFDSDYPATLSSDPGEVDLEVRDQFTIAELVARFPGRTMPAKFAFVSNGEVATILEFMEESL